MFKLFVVCALLAVAFGDGGSDDGGGDRNGRPPPPPADIEDRGDHKDSDGDAYDTSATVEGYKLQVCGKEMNMKLVSVSSDTFVRIQFDHIEEAQPDGHVVDHLDFDQHTFTVSAFENATKHSAETVHTQFAGSLHKSNAQVTVDIWLYLENGTTNGTDGTTVTIPQGSVEFGLNITGYQVEAANNSITFGVKVDTKNKGKPDGPDNEGPDGGSGPKPGSGSGSGSGNGTTSIHQFVLLNKDGKDKRYVFGADGAVYTEGTYTLDGVSYPVNVTITEADEGHTRLLWTFNPANGKELYYDPIVYLTADDGSNTDNSASSLGASCIGLLLAALLL
jgi:hypothetical protein